MYLNTHPLLSILFSLLILNGFYNLSKILSKNRYFVFLEKYAVQGKVILFFLIINFISILFYNLFLFYGINEFFLKIIATSLAGSSLPPIPSGWTSTVGLASAILGQISSMCDPRTLEQSGEK